LDPFLSISRFPKPPKPLNPPQKEKKSKKKVAYLRHIQKVITIVVQIFKFSNLLFSKRILKKENKNI
jgi:hypothetical protein